MKDKDELLAEIQKVQDLLHRLLRWAVPDHSEQDCCAGKGVTVIYEADLRQIDELVLKCKKAIQ